MAIFSDIFLAIFAFSCLIHTSPALTVTPDSRGEVADAPRAHEEQGEGESWSAPAAPAEEELQEEEEGIVMMDSSQIRLGTSKVCT